MKRRVLPQKGYELFPPCKCVPSATRHCGDDVVDYAVGQIWAPHFVSILGQCGKCGARCTFVDDVPVDVEQDRIVFQFTDDMPSPYFFKQRSTPGMRSGKDRFRILSSSPRRVGFVGGDERGILHFGSPIEIHLVRWTDSIDDRPFRLVCRR